MSDEMPIGWPLGLSFLNMRVRVVESLPATSVEPYQLHMPSTSFSSFSSSNLDTQSTASFYEDKSVSLGQLIGLRSGERGQRLYFSNSLRFEQKEKKCCCCSDDGSKVQGRGLICICIPVVLHTLLNKFTKSSKKISSGN